MWSAYFLEADPKDGLDTINKFALCPLPFGQETEKSNPIRQ